ncbi:hypothetical protein KBC03_02200 [Patescibacteria group bacterium]|nr:hypothetical protein [Patescibacteria group bacterium]
MTLRKLKWGIVGFALGQAAVLWYKDKNLQKSVAKAPTFGKKVKTFFDSWLDTNKEMIDDVKSFDYEGTREDVKSFFQKEVKMIEDKLAEFEEKVAEWKEKANDMAHQKAEELSTMLHDRFSDVQEKLTGKWNDVNEKYQVEEKVKALHKHYEQLKKQLVK